MSFYSHSDVHNIKGELPMSTNIPGHEGVGRVVQGIYMRQYCPLSMELIRSLTRVRNFCQRAPGHRVI